MKFGFVITQLIIPVFYVVYSAFGGVGVIDNPGYESLPDASEGWTIGGTGGYYFEQIPQQAHTGSECLKAWNASTPFYVYAGQTVTDIDPGVYSLSVWVKGYEHTDFTLSSVSSENSYSTIYTPPAGEWPSVYRRITLDGIAVSNGIVEIEIEGRNNFIVSDFEVDDWELTFVSSIGTDLATSPSPGSGSQTAGDISLSWLPGQSALSHNVYLGTNYSLVNQAVKLKSDLNSDNIVNLHDLFILTEKWLFDPAGSEPYVDLNNDGKVDILDLAEFSGDWNKSGPVEFQGNYTCTVFDPPRAVLDPGTYYWRVDEINGWDSFKGNVWSFTVAQKLSVVSFDVRNTNQTVYGCSAMAWPGVTDIEDMFSELGFEFLMIKFNGLFALAEPYTNVTSVEGFDPFWSGDIANWNKMKSSYAMAERLGIEVYFYTWEVPTAWTDQNNYLKSQHFDQFARMWASLVKTYSNAGMKPDHIAVFGEQNGSWSPGVSPANYNILVKKIRHELNLQGFADVGISGPVTVPVEAYRSESPADWVYSLDCQGVAAHGFFAIQGHEFDWDSINAETGHAHIRNCWPAWDAAFNTVNPSRDVPVLINNFNCYATTFHGITYPEIESDSSVVVSDTVPWAVRVSEYMLSFFNCGAVGASFWEAADPSFGSAYGILKKPGSGRTPRPVYYAFKSFLPWIPQGSLVVDSPAQQDLHIYSACFVDNAGGNTVVVVVNGTSEEHGKKITLNGIDDYLSDLEIFKSQIYKQDTSVYNSHIVDHNVTLIKESPGKYSFIARLPSDSLLTVICKNAYP